MDCFRFTVLIFVANLHNRYTEEGKIIGTEDRGNRAYGEIVADITSSFMVLLAIYFPSVTGTCLKYGTHLAEDVWPIWYW